MRAISCRTLLSFVIWYREKSMRLSHGALIGKTTAHPADHRAEIPARHNVTFVPLRCELQYRCAQLFLYRFCPSFSIIHLLPRTGPSTVAPLPKIMPSQDASGHAGITTVCHTTSYQIKSSFFTSRTFSGTCGVMPSPAGGFTTGI